MRVAALYDIHANLPALEAVLEELSRERVDQVVIGGDVFPGPMPVETFDRLLDLDRPVHFLLGNGDREVLHQLNGDESPWYRDAPESWRAPVRWTAEQLRPEHGRLIAEWPATRSLDIPNLGRVLFCHATLSSDTEIFTRLTPDERLMKLFAPADAALVVCGHTHMPFNRRVGRLRIVNAGSVGMPFGNPGAYWVMLGPNVEMRRTPYDLEAAAARIRATAYPQAEEFAKSSILQPPSEMEILKAFGRSEPEIETQSNSENR